MLNSDGHDVKPFFNKIRPEWNSPSFFFFFHLSIPFGWLAAWNVYPYAGPRSFFLLITIKKKAAAAGAGAAGRLLIIRRAGRGPEKKKGGGPSPVVNPFL